MTMTLAPTPAIPAPGLAERLSSHWRNVAVLTKRNIVHIQS